MRSTVLLTTILLLTTFTGCTSDLVSPETEFTRATELSAKNGAQLGGMIWADGELFRTVGTPTQFKPGHGPFDRLFTGATFRDGIGAISESKPGDRDYNGGRWEVYQLKAGVTTDYSGADSVEDLDMGDFEPAGNYFECPLRPQRGNGHH